MKRTKTNSTRKKENGESYAKTKSMQSEESSGQKIQNTGKSVMSVGKNGKKQIEKDPETSGTPGMKELSIRNGANNLPLVSDSGRFMDLRDHLENLRKASSGSMNLLDDTTMRLHGLMKSVAEESKKEENPDKYLEVRQTVEVAKQLHNTIRLKLDTVKALHKISKDIEDTIPNKKK